MRNCVLLVSVLICLVQGCAIVPTESPQAIPTQAAPDMSPLEWIFTHPFSEAPPGQAELPLCGFPKGFEPQDPIYLVETMSNGFEAQFTQIEYQRAIDGQVNTENSVEVTVLAYQNAEARREHLSFFEEEGLSWEFQQVLDHRVARFYDGHGDSRIWVSGPYTIVVYSGLDTSDRSPWVDSFAALYLQLYPPQADPESVPQPHQLCPMSPVEWINTLPFSQAPPGQAELAFSGLPEGFEPWHPEYLVETLPSGLEARITQIEYRRAINGQVHIENSVTVYILAYQNVEARWEHLAQLEEEDYSWEFQQVLDHHVARYYNGIDGRIWVSGSYLIVVYSGLDTSDRGPWVDTFAALYLQLYPPQAVPVPTPLPQLFPMSLQEWINTFPFSKAPSGQAELVLSGLPEGFQPQDPEYLVQTLPSGLEAQITQIEYRLAIGGQVHTENIVRIGVFAYQNAEARLEHLALMEEEGLPQVQQVLDNRVARFYEDEYNDGRAWVSGPYMIFIYSSLDTGNMGPWVDTFTALYLQLYPPD